MKIVMVSGIPAFPTHEGNRARILALARAIRELGHELWFVLLPAGISEPNDRGAHLAEFGADRFVEVAPQNIGQRVMRFLRWFPFRLRRKLCRQFNLPPGYYSGLDEQYNADWSDALRDLHARHRFDMAVVEYVFHSAALDAFPDSVRKILDTHDAFADRHKPYVARGILHDYWISLRAEAENRGFRRADTLLAIQEDEARAFADQLGRKACDPAIVEVNHFLDLSREPVADHSARAAVFLASANPANTLSAQRFVEHILPLIREEVPDFRLFLAGSICNVVDDHPAVEKLGRVEHVIDAFRPAPMLVNPMLVGTGINIKLLDALTAGVPTVSTAAGARGLPARFRDSVFVVPDHDARAFAERVVALLRDEGHRRDLGRIARDAAIAWNERQAAALASALRPLPPAGGNA